VRGPTAGSSRERMRQPRLSLIQAEVGILVRSRRPGVHIS
jgi:hypothetical protein